MNNLNSILLEGTVSGKPGVNGRGETKRCSFVVSSLRYLREEGKVKERETRVWIIIHNPNMVKAAIENAYDGRGMRVVGRIADDGEGIYIEAEHVEYRPEFKKKKE